MDQLTIARGGFRQAASTHSIVSGIVAALVGWTAASAVVLAGLHRVGATPVEAASGLLAVTATMAIGTIFLARRHRMPIMLAWSTPGAAMLAGIVLELCLTPVRGFVAHPAEVGPIVLVWLAFRRIAPKWAAPAAFGAALIVIGLIAASKGGVHGSLLPHIHWTSPQFTAAGLLSIALPLYVVTMAGQNVPGTAVLASYDYDVPWRETMATTGVGTLLGACAGGHAINLAAISASLVAAPHADPDPQTRWTAAVAAGCASLILSLLAGALATLITVASPDVIGTVAGLALLGTLASSLAAALSSEGEREAAAITFVIAASGATFLSVGSAFWALLAGLAVRAVTRR